MKKWISILSIMVCAQPLFADPAERAANDKSICKINDSTIELQTTNVSKNNPEYWKEAELIPGLTAQFAQTYRYYTMNTFTFYLIVDNKIITTAETSVKIKDPSPFASFFPTLTLNSEVSIAGQTYNVNCDFIIDGNKQDYQNK